jgi:hypothetical protein
MNLGDIQTVGGVMVVITILVQVLKPAIPEGWVAPVAILSGIVLVVAADLLLGRLSGPQLGTAVLTGFLGGASAVGLYSGQKVIPVRGGQPLLGPRTDTP